MTASTRGLGGGVGVLFLLALWGTDEKPHNKVIKKNILMKLNHVLEK